MVQPTKTSSTKQAAKDTGASGKTTKTNTLVVSGAYMEILIGGPYTHNGVDQPFGHAAIHVVVGNKNITYDFGRYGDVWGPFDSEGEAVLNVWSNFKAYVASEKSLGRTTTGFVYFLENSKAEAVIAHYDQLVSTKVKIKKTTDNYVRYLLPGSYLPTTNNCTTVSLEGAKITGKKIVSEPSKYMELRGLSWEKKIASKTQARTADGIFMPMDVQAMLEGNTEARYDKKNVY